MKKQRQPKLIAICGTNGTGKTYLAKNKLLPKIGRRFCVIDSDNMEPEWNDLEKIDLKSPKQCAQFEAAYSCHLWYKGEKDEKGKRLNNFWKYIYLNLHKCTLVLDDCRDYIPPNIDTEDSLRNVFSRRRQKELDIIIIQHSIKDIPKGLIKYLNALILFNTDDTPQDIATRLGHDWLYNVANRVQQKAQIDAHYHEVIDLKNLRT